MMLLLGSMISTASAWDCSWAVKEENNTMTSDYYCRRVVTLQTTRTLDVIAIKTGTYISTMNEPNKSDMFQKFMKHAEQCFQTCKIEKYLLKRKGKNEIEPQWNNTKRINWAR